MANFFSNLFGGGAEREAAERNRRELDQYVATGNRALDRGLFRSEDALRTGANSADSFLRGNHGLYGDLRNAGYGILDRGRVDSLAALDGARGAYDQLAGLGTKYGGATSLLLDSLGVNGADGNGRAVNAFQAGPGYQFTRDQGLEALNRRRAAAGMLNSGNADIDAMTWGTGLANQTYGDWQTKLGGFINPELSATSGAAAGRASVSQAVADRIGQDTMARLGLEQAVTQGQAGVNTARGANDVALGNSLAGLYTGDAGNRVGIAGNNVSGRMAANNMQAQGEAQGARNLFNGIMSGVTTLAGLPGVGSFGFGNPSALQGALGMSQTGPTFASGNAGMMGGVPFRIFG